MTQATKPRFRTDSLVTTQGVAALLQAHPELAGQLSAALVAFFLGDWGDLDASDKRLNEAALRDAPPDCDLDSRVMGSYKMGKEVIWIIAEPYPGAELGLKRPYGVLTTVLFPDEY